MCGDIFVVIIVGYKKNRIKRGSAGSLPSAADGKDPFAVGGRWQRGHVAPTYASWGMDHLANLPTVADVKAKLMAKTLPLPSAGRTAKKVGTDVLLTSSGGRQRGAQICRPLVDGKGCR